MVSAAISRIISFAFPGIQDQPVVQLEAGLVLLVLGGAVVSQQRWLGFRWMDRVLRAGARHPGAAFTSCTLGALLLHALFQPMLPHRVPEVHDEFSYLLAAETFLAGRVANPSPPAWRSLETAHVLFHPVYASMYPPAQGLLLAAGKWATGDYLAGPWCAAAAVAALAGWMLMAWVPARWALVGAVLMALRIGVFGYWANSYWGGTGGAIGGLLLMGGAPRFLRAARPHDGVLAAFGLLLLASSRPFEGVLCVVATAVAWRVLNGIGQAGLRRATAASVPALLVLLAGGASLLWYNARVTGNAFKMGYNVNMQRYGLAVFPGQSTTPTDPAVAGTLARFYDSQHEFFRSNQTLPGFLAGRIVAFGRFWAFYLGPLLTLPFLALPLLLRSHRWRWLVLAGMLYTAGLALNPWFFPHYFGPALGLLLVSIIQGSRLLSGMRLWGRRPFAGYARALPLICAAVFFSRAALPIAPPMDRYMQFWFQTAPGNRARAEVLDRLNREPGGHLVLVRYSPKHDFGEEWVYNAALIDQAKVIWAHDLDEPANAGLLAHYPGRQVWTLDVDAVPPRLARRALEPRGLPR